MSEPTTQSVRTAISKQVETVMLRVYLSANQTNLTSSSWNKINLNVADYDTGNNFDIINHIFTAPVTGLYKIHGFVYLFNLISGRENIIGIYKNGVLVSASGLQSSSTIAMSISCLDELFLQVGDTIELYANPDVSGAANTVDVASASTSTRLIIRLITKEGIRQ
jgi:hypothetical protein